MTETGMLYDAFGQPEFCRALLDAIAARREIETLQGRLTARPTSAYPGLRGDEDEALEPGQRQEKQSNSVVPLGDRLLLKWFRRLEEGTHPELEIGLHLTELASFTHVAPVAGAIEYQPRGGRPMTVGMLQGFIEHRRTAWEETLDTLDAFIRAVSVDPPLDPPAEPSDGPVRSCGWRIRNRPTRRGDSSGLILRWPRGWGSGLRNCIGPWPLPRTTRPCGRNRCCHSTSGRCTSPYATCWDARSAPCASACRSCPKKCRRWRARSWNGAAIG
jgi:hypothetical protein